MERASTRRLAKRPRLEERLHAYERQYRELAATLAEIGYLSNGTVVRQMLTCGKTTCACHQDAGRRHGPYAYWSTKVQGRTVSRLLSAPEADLCAAWIRNRRVLEQTQRRMLALSKKVAPLILKQRQQQQQLEEQTARDR